MLHNQLRKITLLVVGCFALLLEAGTVQARESNKNILYMNRTAYYPQGYLGGYVFKNGPRDAGESTLLFPLFQTSNQLFFSSLRLLDKSAKPWEGNLAFGYRCLSSDHANLLGVYAGVDRLRSVTGDYFNQANVGAEAWYQDWFIGGNVYQPYGRHRYSAPDGQTFSFRENGGYRNIGFTETTQSALPGVDAEVGRTLVGGLTVYGGGYYFHESGTRTLAGPKARAEYVFYGEPNHKILGLFDRVAVEAVATDDQVRGINYYGGLTVGMSWGGSNANLNLQGTERHMVDRIRRDVDVVTENSYEHVDLPANIRDVSTLDDFNQALVDPKADVVAVHGQINGVSNALIDRNLYLTGGNYQFVQNGKPLTVKLSEGAELVGAAVNENSDAWGRGLLRVDGVGSQITIRDLTLTTDPSAPYAIFHASDNGSMGSLSVEHIVADGGLGIAIDGAEQTATVDHITDSVFNVNRSDEAALWFSASNSAHLDVGQISGNTIKTDGVFRGIGFYAWGDPNISEPGVITVENITNNFISTHLDDYNSNSSGLYFLTYNGLLAVDQIAGNTIETNGVSSAGMAFDASSIGNIFVGNITNNFISTHLDDSPGLRFETDAFGQLSVGQISGNIIETNGAFSDGIEFLINEGGNTTIGNIVDNIILANSGTGSNGINIDANGGSFTLNEELSRNQIDVNNDSSGILVRLWTGTDTEVGTNFVHLNAVTANTITLQGEFGSGFRVTASSWDDSSATEGIIINNLFDNQINRASPVTSLSPALFEFDTDNNQSIVVNLYGTGQDLLDGKAELAAANYTIPESVQTIGENIWIRG